MQRRRRHCQSQWWYRSGGYNCTLWGHMHEDNLGNPEHVVGILFSRSKLTHLQKQVCSHIVTAIKKESLRLKEDWEVNLCSSEPILGSTDTYCFEMMSLVLALSGSTVGRSHLGTFINHVVKNLNFSATFWPFLVTVWRPFRHFWLLFGHFLAFFSAIFRSLFSHFSAYFCSFFLATFGLFSAIFGHFFGHFLVTFDHLIGHFWVSFGPFSVLFRSLSGCTFSVTFSVTFR